MFSNTSRGCYAGDRCKFLHGESERLTPYDKSKVCRFYASGWCRNGDKCWFIHVKPGDKSSSSTSQPPDDDEDNLCSICYDVPVTFGLLGECIGFSCDASSAWSPATGAAMQLGLSTDTLDSFSRLQSCVLPAGTSYRSAIWSCTHMLSSVH